MLPETLKTETNDSFLNNVINRYLTKPEFVNTFGTIGRKSPRVVASSRVPEPTLHRQTYQLQPLIYKKIATVDNLMSYDDLLTKVSRLGVEKNRLPEWGNAQRFNYAPPIDYDKLINWDRYYWYDTETNNPTPQYVTIKNMCTVSTARLNTKQAMHNELIASGNATPSDISTSQAELSLLDTLKQCTCSGGGIGWDSGQWDDNNSEITDWWHINPSTTQPHEPSGTGELWFDTVDNVLKYDDGSQWSLFSPALSSTGNFPWDIISEGSCPTQTDQWSKENKWVHQKDVPNLSRAIRAKMPIIEYNPLLELNEWTYTKHDWMYRGSRTQPWVNTNQRPTLYEMGITFTVTASSVVGSVNTVTVLGDHTTIQPNSQVVFNVNGTNVDYTVFSIYGYDQTTDSTTMRVVESVATMIDPIDVTMQVKLTTTSVGDPWIGFFKHWALVKIHTPVPVNDQPSSASVTYTEFPPAVGGETLFELTPGQEFLTSSDVIRVYVNGMRQFSTFSEVETPTRYSNAIVFFEPIAALSVVRVEIGPIAEGERFMQDITVRTNTHEEFDYSYFSTATVPSFQYRKVEQIKTQPIQYPMFNIFNVDGTTAYQANCLFRFEESSEHPVNPYVKRRIKITQSGKEYHFEQLLIDSDDGPLLCYKDAWAVNNTNSSGIQSIWRKGSVNDYYIPRLENEFQLGDGEQYVSSDGSTQNASVNHDNGDWAVAKQLFFNPHHENKKRIAFSELVTHLRTIIESQTPPPMLTGETTDIYRLLDQPNYGVGGTINEYNDGYDMFISAMFQTSNNPRSLIDFAQRQYDSNIATIKDLCINNAVRLISSPEQSVTWDLQTAFTNAVISLFEKNDAVDFVFGDTTAYDPINQTGIKNWIATMPFFRLAFPVNPIKLVDPQTGKKQLLHHDGHISTIEIPTNIYDAIYNQLVHLDGVNSTSSPDWVTVTKGQFWKNITPGDDYGKLYKFNVVSIGSAEPSMNNPIGSLWFNKQTGIMYVRSVPVPGITSGWAPVSGDIGDISAGWLEIDIEQLIVGVLYEVERRLYEAVPAFDTLAFDFNTLVSTTADQELFVQYLRDQFFEYLHDTKSNPFYTNYDQTDPFTWNYKQVLGAPDVKKDVATVWDASWQSIYEKNLGTAYPHFMPWRLQGFHDKPKWWDLEYQDVTGERKWVLLMWNNIKQGIIPLGYETSTGAPGTGHSYQTTGYNFVCVNTSSTPIEAGGRIIGTDELLPPCANSTETFFNDYVTQIGGVCNTLNDPFIFGEQGVTERNWKISSQFLYGLLHIAFRMQPVRFLHTTFGHVFNNVAGLQVDSVTRKVVSHKDVLFHGDVDNFGNTVAYNGLNQWYVNFIRYNNLDISTSDFREKWVDWDVKLSYQTGSFINTKSLQLSTKYFPVIDNDYQVVVKKTPDMEDYWVDALFVTTQQVGTDWIVRGNSKVPKYDGQDWVFLITTASSVNTELKYYGVKKYQCVFDTVSGLGTTTASLPWAIQTSLNIPGEDVVYEPSDTLTWFTGSPVQVSSEGGMPAPLQLGKTYYLIKYSDNTFKLAESYTHAVNGLHIDITTTPSDVVYVEEVSTTFVASEGHVTNRIWKHLAIDKRAVYASYTPTTYVGVQSVINMIDGYVEYMKDRGWAFNETDAIEVDVSTNRVLSWQVEIDKLIDSIYSGLGDPTRQTEYYNMQLLTYADQASFPVLGISRAVYKALDTNTSYMWDGHNYTYISEQDVQRRVWSSTLNINDTSQTYQEVNPFRNNIWFYTERGIVTNIHTGPYTDIRVDTTIYDQNGKLLPETSLYTFRTDKRTRIRSCSLCGSTYAQAGSVNSTEDVTTRGYDESHIAGAHIFIDGYEHVIMFNDRTTDGFLIFDKFLGLYTTRFSLDFERSSNNSFRPNMGGFFLHGKGTVQNIEHTVDNMNMYYDTYQVNETTDFLEYARALLGYDAPKYLDHINASSKSKFIFWRGMIQNKGSVSAVKSFINARLFVDAKVDEFWAYKVGEYGNMTSRRFNDISISPNDVKKNEVRLHFTTASPLTPGFHEITIEDETRWDHLPDQTNILGHDSNLYFETDVIEHFNVYHTTPSVETVVSFDTKVFDGITIIVKEDVNATPYVMKEGLDFLRINHNTITIISERTGLCHGYVMRLLKDKHNPAKLIDKHVMTNVANIMVWHPAAGYHYHVPMNSVDIQQNSDPARYNTIDVTTGTLIPSSMDHTRPWNSQEKNKIWLDTSSYGYVPYYDTFVFPEVNDRIYLWGKAAEWSTFGVYQWTESPVPPDEWKDYVIKQSINDDVDHYQKPSGEVKRMIYKHINESGSIESPIYSQRQEISNNPRKDYVYDIYGNGPIYPLQLTPIIDPTRGDFNIHTNQPIKVYVNGLYKGTVLSHSIISSTFTSPPSDPQQGDIYKVPVNSDIVWGGLEGEIVQWDDTTATWIQISPTNPAFNALDTVGAYVDVSVLDLTISPSDIVTLEYPLFSVDIDSLDTTHILYTVATPYTEVIKLSESGEEISTYYFWVKDKNVKPSNNEMSLVEIKNAVQRPSVPYMFMQGFEPASRELKAPARMTQVVLRGISNYITETGRFKVRFQLCDLLRDASNMTNDLTRKNVHTQWEMFRQEQPTTIPRYLWNKLTESVIGHKLNDPMTPVPSLYRVAYDQVHDTETRIGLGEGQTFVDKDIALNTIVAELENPKYTLYPIEKSLFLDTYKFNTADNILKSMTYIYESFSHLDTNRIFFSCLHDALSLKQHYGDIFKTSAIALHGIKILETVDKVQDD